MTPMERTPPTSTNPTLLEQHARDTNELAELLVANTRLAQQVADLRRELANARAERDAAYRDLNAKDQEIAARLRGVPRAGVSDFAGGDDASR